mmetsp:Transcript_49184/g.96140  ORF Transcript_49184/g.96140 Transcript_49184/m.96140 type:complete len:161 (-) Transcript_49184:18-500(-)
MQRAPSRWQTTRERFQLLHQLNFLFKGLRNYFSGILKGEKNALLRRTRGCAATTPLHGFLTTMGHAPPIRPDGPAAPYNDPLYVVVDCAVPRPHYWARDARNKVDEDASSNPSTQREAAPSPGRWRCARDVSHISGTQRGNRRRNFSGSSSPPPERIRLI